MVEGLCVGVLCDISIMPADRQFDADYSSIGSKLSVKFHFRRCVNSDFLLYCIVYWFILLRSLSSDRTLM